MNISQAIRQHKADTPAIILMDIETTPHLSYHWRVYDESISPEQMERPSELLCFAAKRLGRRGIWYASRRGTKTDKAVAAEAWKVVDAADMVVAHNGKAFDMKTLSARWAYWRMPPPSPFKTVDTCLIARHAFNFPHNSLDGLARYMDLGTKHRTDFSLWRGCMTGDPAAWQKMERYNCRDVELLEAVYLRLRAYDRRHPNVGIYREDDLLRCVCCGSTAVKALPNLHYLTAAGYTVYRCGSCGKVMRDGTRAYHTKNSGRNV